LFINLLLRNIFPSIARFRILVRKNSERKVCEAFLKVSQKESSRYIMPRKSSYYCHYHCSYSLRWHNVIIDAFYPKFYQVRFKSSGAKTKKGAAAPPKVLSQYSTPMVPGVLFIKCPMNPEIAVTCSTLLIQLGLVTYTLSPLALSLSTFSFSLFFLSQFISFFHFSLSLIHAFPYLLTLSPSLAFAAAAEGGLGSHSQHPRTREERR
jgi:hypothetical protein